MNENTKQPDNENNSGADASYNSAVADIKKYINNFEAMLKLGEQGARGQSELFEKRNLTKMAYLMGGKAEAYKEILSGNLFKAIKQATASL